MKNSKLRTSRRILTVVILALLVVNIVKRLPFTWTSGMVDKARAAVKYVIDSNDAQRAHGQRRGDVLRPKRAKDKVLQRVVLAGLGGQLWLYLCHQLDCGAGRQHPGADPTVSGCYPDLDDGKRRQRLLGCFLRDKRYGSGEGQLTMTKVITAQVSNGAPPPTRPSAAALGTMARLLGRSRCTWTMPRRVWVRTLGFVAPSSHFLLNVHWSLGAGRAEKIFSNIISIPIPDLRVYFYIFPYFI